MMPSPRALFCLWLGLAALLAGCSSHVVKTANYVPVERETAQLAENSLLDVGIEVFGDGLDRLPEDNEDLLVFPEVRKAESRFMPHQLMESLQTSAAWGAVRVVPQGHDSVDVLVEGEILQSDGEMLLLRVKVVDATGREWFERVYEGLASKYAYERRPGADPQADPFQGVYNQVANDMLAYREKLNEQELAQIRTVAELRFAQSFSPEAFGGHLEKTEDGQYEVLRLPAENDPMLERIRRIRERDYLFVDTLQQYYGGFVREMDGPYQEWRKQTYAEVIAMRDLRRSARNRTIAGIAAILGGIAAAGSSNGSAATAGQVGVIGGGYLVKSGFDKGSQAKIHVEALQELGNSLEAEIQPQVIELEDRTITLSGTVENQYEQWRELLKEIYRADTQGLGPVEGQ
ncbi:hypothetical protein F6455_15160 [Proteobacteria bacterium 005FR1]|nr:hypothetical protein [Proteobacteria bacterium 005FR1]